MLEILDTEYNKLKQKVNFNYKTFVQNEIGKNISGYRCKGVGHHEVSAKGIKRTTFNPLDFNLKWSDPITFYEFIEQHILALNLFINRSATVLPEFKRDCSRKAQTVFSAIAGK